MIAPLLGSGRGAQRIKPYMLGLTKDSRPACPNETLLYQQVACLSIIYSKKGGVTEAPSKSGFVARWLADAFPGPGGPRALRRRQADGKSELGGFEDDDLCAVARVPLWVFFSG